MFKNSSNRAFRRGFYRGFASIPRFFANPHYPHEIVATDAQAWREVGALLNQSYREIGADIVKAPSKRSGNGEKQRA